MTLEDAAAWTRPWKFFIDLALDHGQGRVFEYACHEGNYGLRNILSASRAMDAEAGCRGAQMTTKPALRLGVLLIAVAAVGRVRHPEASGAEHASLDQSGRQLGREQGKAQAFGERFATSDAMYEALKQQAHGGKPLTWPQMAEPACDWSGVYTRSKLSLHFDPDLPNDRWPCLREAHTRRSRPS